MFPLISANERCNPVMQTAWAGMIKAVPAVLFPLDLPDDGDHQGLGVWDALPYGSPLILQPRDACCRCASVGLGGEAAPPPSLPGNRPSEHLPRGRARLPPVGLYADYVPSDHPTTQITLSRPTTLSDHPPLILVVTLHHTGLTPRCARGSTPTTELRFQVNDLLLPKRS